MERCRYHGVAAFLRCKVRYFDKQEDCPGSIYDDQRRTVLEACDLQRPPLRRIRAVG